MLFEFKSLASIAILGALGACIRAMPETLIATPFNSKTEPFELVCDLPSTSRQVNILEAGVTILEVDLDRSKRTYVAISKGQLCGLAFAPREAERYYQSSIYVTPSREGNNEWDDFKAIEEIQGEIIGVFSPYQFRALMTEEQALNLPYRFVFTDSSIYKIAKA